MRRPRCSAQDDKGDTDTKKAGTKDGPGLVLAGCPDKTGGCAEPNQIGTKLEKLYLRATAWPYRQVSHLGQDARHLHPVELRNEGQEFGDELIFHQFVDFFLAAAFTAA